MAYQHKPVGQMPVMMARLVAAGDFSGVESAAWLQEGMARFVRGDPLATALRLDRANRTRQRNEALLRLADALQSNVEVSDWDLAGRMVLAIDRFETRIWPRARRELLPVGLGEIDVRIFAVFVADAGLIKSQRGLYDFLALNKR